MPDTSKVSVILSNFTWVAIKLIKVQEKDLKLLWMFILRIGMYTGIENKDTISSFLYGYEIGRDNECNFIEMLAKSIEEQYKIRSKATGWVGQIEGLAEKLETDWITIFKSQSLKILTSKFNEPMTREFTESIKRRMNGKMLGVDNHFRRDWIADWFGIVDLSANWFKEMWSDIELKLLNEIEQELKSFGKVREIKVGIEPTEKLKMICAKLYEEMNRKKSSKI